MSDHGTTKTKPKKPTPQKPKIVRFSVLEFNDEEHPLGAQLAREMLGQKR